HVHEGLVVTNLPVPEHSPERPFGLPWSALPPRTWPCRQLVRDRCWTSLPRGIWLVPWHYPRQHEHYWYRGGTPWYSWASVASGAAGLVPTRYCCLAEGFRPWQRPTYGA